MIWFTSDWHLDHANIIKYANRPFANVAEQKKVILENFFTAVQRGDVVYHLGDFAFSTNDFMDFTKQFRANYDHEVKFYYIEGNHDYKIKDHMQKWADGFYQIKDIAYEKQPITLCHYIMYSFEKSHFNAWQLYGHHHTHVNSPALGKHMNVGVDLNGYKPVSIDEVTAFMQKQPNNWDLVLK